MDFFFFVCFHVKCDIMLHAFLGHTDFCSCFLDYFSFVICLICHVICSMLLTSLIFLQCIWIAVNIIGLLYKGGQPFLFVEPFDV